MTKPTPFTLRIPDADIADLRDRLARTRFPDSAPGEAWAYGTDVSYLRQLVDYWRDGFDWRAEEATLNVFPQFRTSVDGIDLHYLHVPGVGENPMPLLLLHGWPGSVFEFVDIIPRLTDPARFGGDPRDAFTVIAPSLPGFGLSFKPGQKRYGVPEMADCVAALMHDVLGFSRFAAQGGDWGANVTSRLGYAEHPREILTPPRSLAEGTYGNIQRWTRMPRGGHFPALEAPEALAEEIREFFRPLRSGGTASPPRRAQLSVARPR
jgi:microsomal epoxide hydrolase